MKVLKYFIYSCFVIYVRGNSYCDISCYGGGAHTMCVYAENTNCKVTNNVTLTQDDKEAILGYHNYLRQRLAKNEEKLPQAAGMMALYWDDELEIIAHRWARQCLFEHDKCRDTLDGVHVGQNLYTKYCSWQNCMLSPRDEILLGIKGWYDEIEDMRASMVDSYQFQYSTGHYTQLVWAQTSHVGCSYIEYSEGGMTKNIVACNYKPGGNVMNQPIYPVGEACKQCPPETICEGKLCASTLLIAERGSPQVFNAFSQTRSSNEGAIKNQPIVLLSIMILLEHFIESYFNN